MNVVPFAFRQEWQGQNQDPQWNSCFPEIGLVIFGIVLMNF
jgi:hypothetical protein